MKRILILFAALMLGATAAEAQIRLGVNGIEFVSEGDSVATSSSKQKSYYSSSSVRVNNSKSRFSLNIGRSSYSSIPIVECGWNVLTDVDYAPYQGMDVGNFFEIYNWQSTQLTLNLLHAGVYNRQSKVGFNVGLGVRANNYRFSPDMALKRENGMVMPYKVENVKRSKFHVASIHIPAEVMFGNPRRMAFSMGGYLDLAMNSHSKIRFSEGETKRYKENNFPVNFIQAGATARLTFGFVSLYISYQPTQLFKTGCGPKMQQWTIGLGL